MSPGSRLAPEPTRAQEAAADEAHAQHVAATRGAECYALWESMGELLDRYPQTWREDDKAALDRIHGLLTQARAEAEGLG